MLELQETAFEATSKIEIYRRRRSFYIVFESLFVCIRAPAIDLGATSLLCVSSSSDVTRRRNLSCARFKISINQYPSGRLTICQINFCFCLPRSFTSHLFCSFVVIAVRRRKLLKKHFHLFSYRFFIIIIFLVLSVRRCFKIFLFLLRYKFPKKFCVFLLIFPRVNKVLFDVFSKKKNSDFGMTFVQSVKKGKESGLSDNFSLESH